MAVACDLSIRRWLCWQNGRQRGGLFKQSKKYNKGTEKEKHMRSILKHMDSKVRQISDRIKSSTTTGFLDYQVPHIQNSTQHLVYKAIVRIKLNNACKRVKTVWWINARFDLKEHRRFKSSSQLLEGFKWQYKGFEFNSTDHTVASDPRQTCDQANYECDALQDLIKDKLAKKRDWKWPVTANVQNVKPVPF